MAAKELEIYIAKRYDRWLDYALFHCSLAKIEEQANDVLNEVLLMLMTRNEESRLLDMLSRKKNGYTELDFFILNMIKMNVFSPTSPYRYKNRPIKKDGNVDFTRLDILDDEDSDIDRSGEILEKFNRVRNLLDDLQLSSKAREIFEFKFFHGNNFSEWGGNESPAELYSIYQGVQKLLREKLCNTPKEKKEQQLSLF